MFLRLLRNNDWKVFSLRYKSSCLKKHRLIFKQDKNENLPYDQAPNKCFSSDLKRLYQRNIPGGFLYLCNNVQVCFPTCRVLDTCLFVTRGIIPLNMAIKISGGHVFLSVDTDLEDFVTNMALFKFQNN